jgi:hypothetical protein
MQGNVFLMVANHQIYRETFTSSFNLPTDDETNAWFDLLEGEAAENSFRAW